MCDVVLKPVADLGQPDALTPPPRIEFRDPAAAWQNLARLRQFVPASVYESLWPLLTGAADPDSAVNQFERLVETCGSGLLRLLEKHSSLVHYALLVFGSSSWLGETLIHNPDLFPTLLRDRSLDRTHSREEFQEEFARMRSRSFESDTAALLARCKRREYVRILLRDLLEIATLAETTAEISALSDALIEEAVREVYSHLQRRHGTAQQRKRPGRFAVLSLGKLGGNELNYSSDIDLLFLYDGGEQPEGAITSREFFVRLAQQTTELLSRHTKEGPIFRIDLRLRPQGKEGELAIPLAYAVGYYSQFAQDWELQAMIKARHSAGDIGLAREFIRAVQPHVYRPELNFAAIKTALASLERISRRRRRHSAKRPGQHEIDVKLDRGGIRDIEFLVQCLQRVYGGSESWLRSRGTLFALQKLHDKEHISGKDFQNLNTAYEFLRRLEHRLQLRRGQQIHCLPASPEELQCLARSLTRQGMAVPVPEEFLAEVRSRMEAVAEIYQRIIFQEQSHTAGELPEFELHLEREAGQEKYRDQLLMRLAEVSPRLGQVARQTVLSQHARRNLDRFLSSASTTSERYGAVLGAPEALERALTIFEDSEYLTDLLVQYPSEISLLKEVASDPVTSKDALLPVTASGPAQPGSSPIDPLIAYLALPTTDSAQAQALLRQHYRRCLLRSGARDLFQLRDVFASLEENTSAADAAIQAAVAISEAPAGFAILGLGRLGAREFDLLSDADVLFVRDERVDAHSMQRNAERVMETLTAYTRAGTVFPVDARLRPHGREGELVITPRQLSAYFEHEAQPWEALTYLKLRFVAGDRGLGQRTVELSRQSIAEIARRGNFVASLAEMRNRLEVSEAPPSYKTGAGGAYDIDYLAGTIQARHQLWLAGDLRDRLRLVRENGLLEECEYEILAKAALWLRTVEHLVRLVTGRPHKWLPVAEHAHRAVQKLLGRAFNDDGKIDPEARLVEVLRQTRSIYVKYRHTPPRA